MLFSERKAAIISLELNLENELILAITSRGDALVFNLYLELLKHLNGDEIIPEARFVQAIWTEGKVMNCSVENANLGPDFQEIAVLHRNGLVIQEDVDIVFEKYLLGTLQGTVVECCTSLSPTQMPESGLYLTNRFRLGFILNS